MIGNVWELTADRWTPDHTPQPTAAATLARAPARGVTAGQRVIKGGSFLCAPNYCMRYRAGARQAQDEDLAISHLGFRTIRDAAGIVEAPPALFAHDLQRLKDTAAGWRRDVGAHLRQLAAGCVSRSAPADRSGSA